MYVWRTATEADQAWSHPIYSTLIDAEMILCIKLKCNSGEHVLCSLMTERVRARGCSCAELELPNPIGAHKMEMEQIKRYLISYKSFHCSVSICGKRTTHSHRGTHTDNSGTGAMQRLRFPFFDMKRYLVCWWAGVLDVDATTAKHSMSFSDTTSEHIFF